jgi:hypothetical protein
MTRNSFCLVLSLMATMLLATSSSGQACSAGMTVHYVGIGSSVEFITFKYGAESAIAALPGYTAPTNVWTRTDAEVQDMRVPGPLVDKGLRIWVVYDSSATCNVYVGYQADSVQGVKDFYCYAKLPGPRVGVVADCYGFHDPNQATSWELGTCVNVIPGNPCSPTAGVLPLAISMFLVTQPIPACNVTCSPKTQALPQPYCGSQTADIAGFVGTQTQYCYFNAAPTELRPEDALYATTRAMSAYSTTNSLYGLGYNNINCTPLGVTNCPVMDSFNRGGLFYALTFALKGTDPYTTAIVPTGTTLAAGASPVVVFVSNADSTNSLGFGVQSNGSYLHRDVLHKVLAQIFEGVDSCTGDLLATTPSPSAFGGAIAGLGQPIQAVLQAPLSGAYNIFEFTAVRTFSGSGLDLANSPDGIMIGLNRVTTATTGSGPTWVSDQESSQELDVRFTLPQGPATGWTNGTNSPHCSPFPDGTQNCGDPLWYQTGPIPGSHGSACGKGLKTRAIGTGDEVKATLGIIRSPSPNWSISDGIGYAFWGYLNFSPACVGPAGTSSSGDVTCSQYLGHYLTVDAIDPLFATEGGAGSPTVPATSPENPNGGYNFPQCGLVAKAAGYSAPCAQIPFTHIYDGKYPLWSMLRVVTFANQAANAVHGSFATPEGVINVVAYANLAAAPGSAIQLSEFVPFWSKITGLPYTQGGAMPTANLNLGVFRVHFQQSGVPPDNGHKGCAPRFNFTNVTVQGGTPGISTCLVDAGGDVGGSVKTVEADVNYYLDLGGAVSNGIHYPLEIYNLHQ